VRRGLKGMRAKMKLLSSAFLIGIKGIGALPIGWRASGGAALGRLFALFPTRDRKICKAQLRTFLGPDATKFLPGVYAQLGKSIAESLNLKPLLARPELFQFLEEDRAKELMNSGRPLICLTGHIGNWDLFGALMNARGFPVTAIGREARNKTLQTVLAALRDSYGIQTIWRTGSAQGARDILRALKGGRWVAALIDQDTRVAGAFVPFFGIPAVTPSSLIDLALRQKAHIVSAFLVREGLGGYVAYRELPSSGTPEETLAAYHLHLEEVIRRNPEQWVWIHKRWRTLANGERLSSREYLKILERGELSPPQSELLTPVATSIVP